MKKRTGMFNLSLRMSATAMMLTGIGLAMPRLTQAYGFTDAQQGLLVSIQYIGFTLAVLLGGALSDRFGHRRMLTVALLGLCVAAALLGGVWAYWVAVAAVVLIGIFGSIAENAVTALAMEDESRKDVNNIIVQAAFCAGAVLLPAALLISMLWRGQWRPPYYMAGAFALALFLLSLKRRGKEPPHVGVPVSRILEQYASFFRRPAYLIAPAAMFLYVGAEVGIWAFTPTFFEKSGYGDYSGVIASILIWTFMFIGRIATTKLVDRFGINRTMVAFGVLAVASLAVMTLLGGLWAIAAAGVAGFACAPFFPLIVSWMTRITGEKSGTMIAFTMACGTLGSAALTVLMGFVPTQYVMLLPLACFVGILALLLAFGKRGAASAA